MTDFVTSTSCGSTLISCWMQFECPPVYYFLAFTRELLSKQNAVFGMVE